MIYIQKALANFFDKLSVSSKLKFGKSLITRGLVFLFSLSHCIRLTSGTNKFIFFRKYLFSHFFLLLFLSIFTVFWCVCVWNRMPNARMVKGSGNFILTFLSCHLVPTVPLFHSTMIRFSRFGWMWIFICKCLCVHIYMCVCVCVNDSADQRPCLI